MPMGGSTTPITMAGSLVVGIAEALSSVCVIQAAFPGAPVFICFIPSVMDLKSGDFTGGAPEDTIMAAAVARRRPASTACRPSAASTRAAPRSRAGSRRWTTRRPPGSRWPPASTCSPASAWSRAGASSATRRWRWAWRPSRTHATIAAGVDLTAAGGSAGGQAVVRRRPRRSPSTRRSAAGRPAAGRPLWTAPTSESRAAVAHAPPAGARPVGRRGAAAPGAHRLRAATRAPRALAGVARRRNAQILTTRAISLRTSASRRLAFRGPCCINPSRIRRAGGVRHRMFLTGGGGRHPHPRPWLVGVGRSQPERTEA